jgi:hypothetical protein
MSDQTSNNDQLYGPSEAADYLSSLSRPIKPITVSCYASQGKIPVLRRTETGRTIFSRHDLKVWDYRGRPDIRKATATAFDIILAEQNTDEI